MDGEKNLDIAINYKFGLPTINQKPGQKTELTDALDKGKSSVKLHGVPQYPIRY